MSNIKTAILVAAAVVAATVAVNQYLGAEKLRAANGQLLEQNQKLGELQAENQRLAKLAAGSDRSQFTGTQSAELLRLRGQVGRLRKELEEKKSAAANQRAAASKSDTPDDGTQPFTANLTARVGDRQTLVMGGWPTTPGKRTFMLMTPVIDAKEGSTTQVGTDGTTFEIPNAKVTFETCTVEMSEAMLGQLGLAQYKTEGQDSLAQNVLTAADAEALLKIVKNPPDGEMTVSHGRITTSDGMTASMSMMGTGTPSSDGQAALQYTIGLTPNLTGDMTAVNLVVKAQVARPAGAARAN